MTAAPRRSYEAGHRPKFLVVVDDTEECDRAVYFAARRAGRVGAALALLSVVTPGEFQHWFGVGDVMRQEAEATARAHLARVAARAREVSGVEAEQVVREGQRSDELVAFINEDEDIALLVLAAGVGAEGPGPLVASIVGKWAATFPIPVAVVPGHLSDTEIDALA
ncbi:universal stress protein [Methylopila turkensis]|uniref:Universal stress protein A n=1 Tax=Methylopila turkensis TaxID=1437816 RepID=A0A9W6JP66_9HYPH|nr:universal stress protein [Methylopila turkensis]GLK79324.1 universal stress protein A [Methylopila turkensis]